MFTPAKLTPSQQATSTRTFNQFGNPHTTPQPNSTTKASLTINEELSNQAGIATTTGQLGILRTDQDRPAEGIPHTISALAIHLELESPEVSTDISCLARQQQEIGEEDFTESLTAFSMPTASDS
jgi:hypothetical protein